MATQTFAANIGTFSKKVGLRHVTVVKKLAFDGYAGVVKKSPVDQGRFRGSWRVSIGKPDLTVEAQGVEDADIYPQAPVSGVESYYLSGSLAPLKWGDEVWITNNLPYADRLENQAWSKQAPNGMLKITFEELKTGLASVVASLPD